MRGVVRIDGVSGSGAVVCMQRQYGATLVTSCWPRQREPERGGDAESHHVGRDTQSAVKGLPRR